MPSTLLKNLLESEAGSVKSNGEGSSLSGIETILTADPAEEIDQTALCFLDKIILFPLVFILVVMVLLAFAGRRNVSDSQHQKQLLDRS